MSHLSFFDRILITVAGGLAVVALVGVLILDMQKTAAASVSLPGGRHEQRIGAPVVPLFPGPRHQEGGNSS